MANIKSVFDERLDELRRQGLVEDFTSEENLKLGEQFMAGFDEFKNDQAKRQKIAEERLKNFRITR